MRLRQTNHRFVAPRRSLLHYPGQVAGESFRNLVFPQEPGTVPSQCRRGLSLPVLRRHGPSAPQPGKDTHAARIAPELHPDERKDFYFSLFSGAHPQVCSLSCSFSFILSRNLQPYCVQSQNLDAVLFLTSQSSIIQTQAITVSRLLTIQKTT